MSRPAQWIFFVSGMLALDGAIMGRPLQVYVGWWLLWLGAVLQDRKNRPRRKS